MSPMSRRTVVLLTWVLLPAAVPLTATPARAAEPFKISGAGVGPHGLPFPGQDPREHWSVGEATHLGLYYGDGTLRTDTAVPSPTGTDITGQFGGGSPYTFTGADGDELVTWYGRTDHGAAEPGAYDISILGALPDGALLVQASFVAEFVAVPGQSTGRFAGVTGSWTMYAETAPFVLGSSDPLLYWWEGTGSLTFPRGR